VLTDSLQIGNDSIPEDSISSFREMISPNAITAAIQYVATDSIQIGLKEQKVYLYNNVEIYYQDITLKAGYVEIDFKKNLLYATGIADSSGKTVQKPNFQQGDQNFTAANITYNFNTKKGLIKDIITQEGDSYLHGSVVKRFADNTTNVKDGKYTTCSEEHPHYEIKFFKAKVIPNDKIVTGPAYLVIEDVPTPLIVPFGFFPTKKGQVSGILMPTYGQSANRGFYFEDGGYYWGINDYVDLAVRGTIYTRGSWGAKVASSYSKRYRYQGNISISYAENIFGEKDLPDYRKDKSFFIRWQHKQDPKARPNSSFSANVNAGTNNYNKYNPTSAQDYLSNDFESTITYQTSFAQNRCNFAISAGYKQNTGTKEILLTAPEMAFSISRIYPFRKKNKTKLKFWDNISLGYTLNAANRINTPDSMLISNSIFRRMQNGISHNIPLNMSMKVFRYFTWNTSFNYNERWYFQSVNKGFYNNGDTSYIYQDTIQGFQPARDFNVASSLTTKVYTMFQFKKGPVNAIRYVMTPIANFNYHPDFGSPWWGYYRYTVSDTLGHYQRYSRFQNGIYGTPPDGRSGKVGLGISNNLEMKVRSRKDTITGTKKIMLIEDLTIRTAYDLARDSLNWDNLTVSGRTRLFKRIDVNYSGNWDFYAIDTNGNRINQFEWDVNHKLLRKTSYQWSVSVGFTLSSKDFKKKTGTDNSSTNAPPTAQYHPVPDVDYNNPWSLTFNYNLTYGKRYSSVYDRMVPDTSHTLNVSGDIAITKKWKFGFTTGYDFVHNNFSYTSINIYRDLHCWEMILNWIPMGYRQSYNFTIRVKASILQDLKLEKKTDWRDYY
jgi:lipopolysaccharide assembly outer membrane protein LptD (OstA)